MRFSQAELDAYMQRDWLRRPAYADKASMDADEGPEGNLQRKCEAWLREKGYPYIHDRSRGANAPGSILDLHIYLPMGRHVVIELKAKGGKMSDDQKETYRKILFLGHEIHEVKSFKRFLEIMETN